MKATLLSLTLLLAAPMAEAQSPKSTNPPAAGQSAELQVKDLNLSLAGSHGASVSRQQLLANPVLTIGASGYMVAYYTLRCTGRKREELIGPVPIKGSRLNDVALGILRDAPIQENSRIFVDDIVVVQPDGVSKTLKGALSFKLTE